MSHRRTVRKRVPEAGAFDPSRLSPQGEASSNSISGWRQCLASLSATLTMVIVGTINGWTTISLLYLISGTGGVPLTLTHDEASWMVSFTVLGSMIGSLLAAQLTVRCGRRNCLLLCSTMFTVGWCIIFLATSVRKLFLARVILGIGVGIAHTVNPKYVSEIADIKIRCNLGFLTTVNASVGTLVTYVLGVWMTYESLLLLLVIISFICFLSATCFSATRYISVTTDQEMQARKSRQLYSIAENPLGEEIELRALHVQTRHELHSQPTSEIQPQSTSEVYPSSTSETHPEPTSEIQSESTSEIHPASTIEIQPPSTSEVYPSFTSEIQPPSTSEVYPSSTSETHPEPTSEIQSESTSELHQPSTSEIQPQSTSEVYPSSTSETHPEPTSEIQSESTSEIHPASTIEIQPPSTSEVYPSSTSETHPEPTSEIQSESTSELHQPSTSEIQPQSTSEVHTQSTRELQQPSTSEIHPEHTKEIHPGPTSELHQPSTSEIQPQSTREIHTEPTSEIHPEPTSKIHPELTRKIHPEPTREKHSEPIREIHPESTTEIHPEHTREIYPRSRRELHHLNIVTKYTWSTKLREILRPSNRNALLIMFCLIMAQQFSGNFITMQYLNVLFSKIPMGIGPNVATMMVLAVGLITSSLTTIIVECLKRRKLLILSGFGTCLTLCFLGIYLFLDEHEFDVSNASILPVIDLIIYQIMYQIGLGTLPNVLLCELFPAELKGIVGAIIVIFDGIIGFIMPKLYQYVTDTDGWFVIYIVFAAVSSSAFLMLFILVPETEGKTYPEIEALLLHTYLSS